MDRQQLIGFVLIFVIVSLWSLTNQPAEDAQVIEATQNTEEVTTQPEIAVPTATPALSMPMDSMSDQQRLQLLNKYSVLAPASMGDDQEYTLENDVLKLALSSKGGVIKYVELKNYNKISKGADGAEQKSLVRLLEDSKNVQNYKLKLDNREVNTADLYFSAEKTSGNSITLSAIGDNGARFSQTYTLEGDNSYAINYDIATQGLSSALGNASDAVTLQLENYMRPIELNRTFETRYSTVYYRPTGKDSDYCSCTGDDADEINDKDVQWFSFAHQFFNTTFISDNDDFKNLVATTQTLDPNADNLKLTAATVQLPLNNGNYGMQIYAGPNEFKNLKAFDNKMDEIIPFGRSIFGTINRVIIRPFFDWLSGFISSKGLVIILLIFIIKMLLYPLTYKMLHSQAKMGALKPQLAGLKEKYKDDMQKQQMETMKIYREYGVSPMGGCMPMLLQMPIWYALFRFFPASITFRQEPFLWANDLSSYDAFFQLPFSVPGLGEHLSLFTILWAISTVAYTFYNMRHMDMSANPAMKYVQYLMPLMFFVFFNNFASGLTCYMLFSNLINIAQTLITKNFVFDNDKILAELNVQKAKPRKKSGFQAKLEEAMKQQQKIQEERAAQKKKRR